MIFSRAENTEPQSENDLDSLIIKKKEAFSYSPNYFSFSSQSAPNMLNTVVVVPYGTKAAYVAKGWVGEGDDGTQVVKQVVEAEPEPVNFDLNSDSKIDIGDVTKLVNEVLKQPKP